MTTSVEPGSRRDRQTATVAALLVLAAFSWWWATHASGVMHHLPMQGMGATSMSFIAFLVAWVAMMAAMMLPAIVPAVRLFARAASRGQATPTPVFVAGYLLVWSAMGVPAYFAWRALAGPLADTRTWAAYLAGAVLVIAGIYQVSPLKNACLRHCRSPLSFFLRQRCNLKRPLGALRAGIAHGSICLGCCWALMAVLVALGTMHLGWMLAIAALIFVEKTTPIGERAAGIASVALVALGLALWLHPDLLVHLT
jgi:predicted metal-binding membrane protein